MFRPYLACRANQPRPGVYRPPCTSQLDMEIRAGRAPRPTKCCDPVARLHRSPRLEAFFESCEMGIASPASVCMLNFDHEAVVKPCASKHHGSARSSVHATPDRGTKIDAWMQRPVPYTET